MSVVVIMDRASGKPCQRLGQRRAAGPGVLTPTVPCESSGVFIERSCMGEKLLPGGQGVLLSSHCDVVGFEVSSA